MPELAVLLTDYSESFAKTHGNFYHQSRDLLLKSGISDEYDIKVYDAQKQEYPTEEDLQSKIKAIWVTGSVHDAFDNQPWILHLAEFLKNVIENREIPIIGICFGHQIVGRAIGGRLGRNLKGWELGIETVKIADTPEINELFKDAVDAQGEFNIIEVHQDIVSAVPEGYAVIGSTPKTDIQGIYKKGKVLTFQGHPEFTKPLLKDITLDLSKKGGIMEEIEKKSLNDLEVKEHDGMKLAKVIVDFIHDTN